MSEVVMLCQEIKKEQAEKEKSSNDYLYQVKFDGVRGLVYIENHKIKQIVSRGNKNLLKQFVEFKELTFEFNGILDTEIIVATNGKECGDFNEGIAFRSHLENEKEIQERAVSLRGKIMVFDIIQLNKESLKLKPLHKRLEILRESVKDNDLIEVAKNYSSFDEIWAMVEQEQLEGCIRKHKSSAYEFVRSKYSVKIKNWKEQMYEFNAYELAKSETNRFYKGIVLTNSEGIRCSCLGKKSEEVKKIIDENGSVKVNCQYLENTKGGKARFITFKELVNELSLLSYGVSK